MTDSQRLWYARWIPAATVTVGVALFVVDWGAALYFIGLDRILTPPGIVGRTIGMLFCVIVVAGGYRLYRSDIEPARYRRVGGWVCGFAVAFLVVNLLLITFLPADTLYGNLAWAIFAVYVGTAGGVVVGVVEARAISRAVRAERKAVRAEQADAQRQWFDYLNSLLRHEVLNNTGIIQGYASLLMEEDLDSPACEYAETISHQSQEMTEVIGDVRVLIRAADEMEVMEERDVVAILQRELEDLRATYQRVETEFSADDDAYVRADDMLPRIFSNLLSNAVEHHDGETPHVSVTVETTSRTVRVHVADDGPGIPETERETLFERGQENHGLGLYLVCVLAERYDGTVELAETGLEGSVFTVELPRVEAPDTEESSSADPSVGPARSPTD